jgi:ClpP class serine protease
MSIALHRLAEEVFDQPLLYHAGKAATFVRTFGPRLTGQQISIVRDVEEVDHTAFANRPLAGILGDRLGRAFDQRGIVPFDVIDGVAMIPIEGTLVRKGSFVGSSSGETSYQGLQVQIERAKARSDVKGVVFEVDSFGGHANGAFEAADAIYQLSRAKPTIAILTDFAYSAGYLLASQARTLVLPEFGGAGSIGVVMLHADYSANFEQEGIRVTLIHAGSHKVDGNPYQPLPRSIEERWQGECEAMRQRFAEVVARGRRGKMTKASALKTEADSYTAAAAVDLGLADAVADPREAFTAFMAEVKGS